MVRGGFASAAGTSHAARGWASTIVVVLLLGGLLLICIV
jgi:hypothetical protein